MPRKAELLGCASPEPALGCSTAAASPGTQRFPLHRDVGISAETTALRGCSLQVRANSPGGRAGEKIIKKKKKNNSKNRKITHPIQKKELCGTAELRIRHRTARQQTTAVVARDVVGQERDPKGLGFRFRTTCAACS